MGKIVQNGMQTFGDLKCNEIGKVGVFIGK
jgi:hypothetical protein